MHIHNTLDEKETKCEGLLLSGETIKSKIESLLRSTGRENIERVITWLEEHNFYTVPASVGFHNNFEGGLAKHSFEVCEEAIKLNETENLPLSSVIICSLLHDVCKYDNYFIDNNGKPVAVEENKNKGHGRRSMYIVKRGCQLPLNYDEEMAIWWHMGEYEVSKDIYPKDYMYSKNIALCRLIQGADYNVTHKTDGQNANDK